MVFQSAAMVAKKLLVDDKISACVKQKNVSSVLYVKYIVYVRQTLSFQTFCFLGKRLLSLFKFCASINLLFFISC